MVVVNKDNKDADTKEYVNVEEIIDDIDTESTKDNNDNIIDYEMIYGNGLTKKEMQLCFGIVIVIVCGIVGISFATKVISNSNNSGNSSGGLLKKTAYCESGYSLNDNNMCEKTDTITAEETITYYCVDSSMQLVGTQCVSKTYLEPIVDYTCPTWYRYSYLYNTCVISSYKSNNDPCPGDSVQILGQCYPYKTKPTRIDRKCYTGTLVGTQCVLETKVSAIPNYTYTCPVGYTQVRDTICTKTITKEPSYK